MTNPFAVGRISPDSERDYVRVSSAQLGENESPEQVGIEAAIRDLNSLRELNAMAGIEVLGIRLGDLTRRVRELELRQEV